MGRSNQNISQYMKILNYWLGYNFLLIIASNLPHWPVPLLPWINCSLYFLIAVVSFTIFKANAYNKEIYFNIFITFLLFSLGIVSIFIGENYSFGNDYIGWYVYEYRKIGLAFLLSFTVIYIGVKKIWGCKSVALNYIFTALIIMPFFLVLFKDFLLDKDFLFKTHYVLLYKNLFLFKLLPLLFICLYGLVSLKYDRPMGEYTNSTMAIFFLILGQELFSYYSSIRKIIIIQIDQFILTISLILLLVVLLKKVAYILSEIGKFYEALLQGHHKELEPLVELRSKKGLLTFRFFLYYLDYRRNFFLFVVILFALGINIVNLPLFLKLNIFLISLFFLIIVLYFSRLYSRYFQR